MNTLFLEPLDVLYLRGNQHFGTAGAHGAALMPPWPSLVAGAIRSRLMAEGETIESLANFRLLHFGLGLWHKDGTAETLLPLPADVLVAADKTLDDARYARPVPLPESIASSNALPSLPAFALDKPAKPVGGLWLTSEGIRAWLNGAPIAPNHLRHSGKLWRTDPRLGIALDPTKRSAADGKIYTAEAVALCEGVGFVARYDGAPALPENSLVRLGGDGRGAVAHTATLASPEPDWTRIEKEGRFRLLLLTPGLFADGWKPQGVPGELIAACVNRGETISGWDMAANDKRGAPKTAQRVAPAGSVYWFGKLADLAALRVLADNGLPLDDPARRAEGFNRCLVAPWAKEE